MIKASLCRRRSFYVWSGIYAANSFLFYGKPHTRKLGTLIAAPFEQGRFDKFAAVVVRTNIIVKIKSDTC
jgi:hypothetical protein